MTSKPSRAAVSANARPIRRAAPVISAQPRALIGSVEAAELELVERGDHEHEDDDGGDG